PSSGMSERGRRATRTTVALRRPPVPVCGAIATFPTRAVLAEPAMTGTVPDMFRRGVAGRCVCLFGSTVFGVIRARGLEKRYGDRRVLRGVEFELTRGGLLLVTGPNGSGRTTLLRLSDGLAT